MLNKSTSNSVKPTLLFLSDNEKFTVSLVNYVILCGTISVIGSATNVINMIVFYRQGLDTTININFFSLAVSDLCSLILQQFFNLFVNPLFVELDLHIVHTEFQYLTVGLNREMFARITCQITAFITAERCLCVVFPLHVKRIITPRITITVIIIIYVYTLISPVPVYCTSYFAWKFYPDLNTTILGLSYTKHHVITEPIVYLTHAFVTLFSFLAVLIFTLVLIYKLAQKSAWRQTAKAGQDNSKSLSKRDRATITMVVLIASILVVCYTPAVMLGLATYIEPRFSVGGEYYNIYYCSWTFAFLFENINSSINIFLYYKMSTKYRQTCRELLSCCFKHDNNVDTEKESVRKPITV